MFKPVIYSRREFGSGKSAVIISSAQIAPGEYEVMTMLRGGDEIESYRTRRRGDLNAVFAQMVERYGDNASARRITPKMRALIDALKLACDAARAAREEDDEDGGTCNFDSPALNLPHWRSADIEACAKAAGLTVHDWRVYNLKYWVFSVPGPCGQANLRSRMAEAMTASLKASGFDALEYCQLD